MKRSIAKYVVVSTDLSEGAMAVAKADRTDRRTEEINVCVSCLFFALPQETC